MTATIISLWHKGGVVMIAILGMGVVLYAHCFYLLLFLWRLRLRLNRLARAAPVNSGLLAEFRIEAGDTFARRRVAIGAMIAAAPLLGLLGTVMGMGKTFASLADRGNEKSIDALASGISQVLVATESGLAVALPALVLVGLAHAETQRLALRTVQLEALPGRKGAPC